MTEHVHHAMDRNIFNQNLSVEATSAYILVTSLIGENQSPTLDLIREKWTVTPEKLDNALKETDATQTLYAKNRHRTDK
jgi:hypothetical protein